jgi:hypothetical protein
VCTGYNVYNTKTKKWELKKRGKKKGPFFRELPGKTATGNKKETLPATDPSFKSSLNFPNFQKKRLLLRFIDGSPSKKQVEDALTASITLIIALLHDVVNAVPPARHLHCRV